MSSDEKTVTFNRQEALFVRYIARKRYVNNRLAAVTNALVACKPEKAELEGFGGEFGFGKVFNLFPDFSVRPRSARLGTDPLDFILDGMTIDVKTTDRLNGRLLVRTTGTILNPPDFYALMVGSFGKFSEIPRYTFKGFMAGTELLKRCRIRDLGHGPTYTADQDELVFDLVKLTQVA